jgi:hypothetical protein
LTFRNRVRLITRRLALELEAELLDQGGDMPWLASPVAWRGAVADAVERARRELMEIASAPGAEESSRAG